jgi:hypothetical protein
VILNRFMVGYPHPRIHLEVTSCSADVIGEGFDIVLRVRLPPRRRVESFRVSTNAMRSPLPTVKRAHHASSFCCSSTGVCKSPDQSNDSRIMAS